MKLLLVIVKDVDADNVVQRLVEDKFRVTRMSSTGGFLRRGNVTLLVGLIDREKDDVIKIIKDTCTTTGEEAHKATVFVVDMPHFEQVT